MANYKIDEIEGIGPSYGAKLKEAGLDTTESLLEACSTPNGREEISEKTGIGQKQLLNWANMADLMRISGVGKQYAELLECAGVDTVKELRTRNAANLAERMTLVNQEKKVARTSPPASLVAAWIEQAGALEPKIQH